MQKNLHARQKERGKQQANIKAPKMLHVRQTRKNMLQVRKKRLKKQPKKAAKQATKKAAKEAAKKA